MRRRSPERVRVWADALDDWQRSGPNNGPADAGAVGSAILSEGDRPVTRDDWPPLTVPVEDFGMVFRISICYAPLVTGLHCRVNWSGRRPVNEGREPMAS
jgi:hypothetical protein